MLRPATCTLSITDGNPSPAEAATTASRLELRLGRSPWSTHATASVSRLDRDAASASRSVRESGPPEQATSTRPSCGRSAGRNIA